MRCPQCHFDNRESAKFCSECGNRLEIICFNCGHLNPPGGKFCEECGSKLGMHPEPLVKEPSDGEKLGKIQKYLPKGLVQKILVQKDGREVERKLVTVMFCDMAGFTALVDKLEPEEGYAVMDQVYEILIHMVHDYEGTVNEMTCDGIMALFGAPIALEDAPQRSIRSSLAIHREITNFSEKLELKEKSFPTIKMRIGIHTGQVVDGSLLKEQRNEIFCYSTEFFFNLGCRNYSIFQCSTWNSHKSHPFNIIHHHAAIKSLCVFQKEEKKIAGNYILPF